MVVAANRPSWPSIDSSDHTCLLYAGEDSDRYGGPYLRVRYYSPDTGRFSKLDPFAGNEEDPQSLHKYAYVHGDPINNVDPSGKFIAGLLDLLAAGQVQYGEPGYGTFSPGASVGPRVDRTTRAETRLRGMRWYFRTRNLPVAILDDMISSRQFPNWGIPNGMLNPVFGGGPYYGRVTNTIYLPNSYYEQLRTRTLKMTRISDIYNELWHAWFDLRIEESPAGKKLLGLIQGEANRHYGGNLELVDEAISETIASAIVDLGNNRRPTYKSSAQAPGHTDEGGRFEGRPEADRVISKELFDAVINALEHGLPR